ncbi:DUF5685 family protein [Oscillospiraceae bacterium OttesenSCG-928-G22]|nr:DUF5685 family protein [Oscillospiraceae bacterium OttesenSCG-928-G22]
MFGYIRPIKGDLSEAEMERFQAVYCGLCHTLGKRYGFFSRFLLSYDLTFLGTVLMGLAEEPRESSCVCPANPFRKKRVLLAPGLELAADLTILFAEYKLLDTERDEGFFKRFGAQFLRLFFARAFRKARRIRPDLHETIRRSLAELWEMEERREPSLDRPADAFAGILRVSAAEAADGDTRRVLEPLFYHIGRFVYLIDAVDDYAEDNKHGTYNPIAARYALDAPAIPDEVRDSLSVTLSHSLHDAYLAAELLPEGEYTEIILNILTLGLPAVSRAVFHGEWRKKEKPNE